MLTQQTGPDAVERTGPGQGIGHDPGIGAENLAGDPFDAFRHFGRGAPRERHQQNPAGVGAIDDQMGDAMGEGVRLAGSGAGDDQQGRSDMAVQRHAVFHGPALFGI